MVVFLISLVLLIMCATGFVLFARIYLRVSDAPAKEYKISVIIPARNEEKNLPSILNSLQAQTVQPYEIIVVDDFSTDRTAEIAREYGVKLVSNEPLPEGWTGKTWAVWNGYKHATGDMLFFLDADIRMAPNAFASLLAARERSGGAISIVPFHYTEKLYEKLSLVLYVMGLFSFTSPFERSVDQKGMYGSCIVVTREDYEKVKGHESIKAEILDDLNIGKRFAQGGIRVENFLGSKLVSFRMYPDGLKSELQGFGKGAVLSTAILRGVTVGCIAFWLVGLLVTGFAAPILLALWNFWAIPFGIGYILYMLQLFYFTRRTGMYGIVMQVFYFIPLLFFIVVMLYSIAQVQFKGTVTWKGRQIKVVK